MKLLVQFLMFFAIGVLGIATGCKGSIQVPKDTPSSKKNSPAFLRVFSDFEFVGIAPISDHVEVSTHDESRKVFPTYLETNWRYVFHHRRVNDNEEKVYDKLHNRLKANGITILETKVGPYRYIGGGEFLITFQEGEIKGTIFTTLDWHIVSDPKLSEQWEPDDYVVVLETVGTS